ncbi:helix-turn-helix domain-containing protein [Streptomyces sp. MS19]|uniref:helix-turn-helix domain-containing protein n=1 Tax=Streptomyces sp. MS19 TaxID=3385972 RepID=UPI0039A27FFD
MKGHIPTALGEQLRAWRVRMGMREGGAPATQEAVARRAGHAFSVRWLRELEAGRGVRPDHDRLTALASALGLSQAELDGLFVAVGLRTGADAAPPSREALADLRTLVSEIPSPAVVTDLLWDIHVRNEAFEGWLPGAADSGRPNLIEWLLFASDARAAFGGEWHSRVHSMVESLKFTRLLLKDDAPLEQLLESLRRSPEFALAWNSYPGSHPPPADSWANSSASGSRRIQVLRPVASPSLRLVVITALDDARAEVGAMRQRVSTGPLY